MATSDHNVNYPFSPHSESALKRRFGDLLTNLHDTVPTQLGKKRKTNTFEDDVDDFNSMDPYLDAAKWVVRAMHPFMSLAYVIDVGVSQQPVPLPVNPEDSRFFVLPSQADRQRKKIITVYNALLSRVPAFPQLVQLFREDGLGEDWKLFVSRLNKAALQARTGDTSGLKHKTGFIVLKDVPEFDKVQPEISPLARSKHDRGWNHRQLAQLLCPRGLLDELRSNPCETYEHHSFVNKFKDGTIEVLANAWPTFLYEHDVYDPDDLELGLMRGALLVRTARHIFTGPVTWNVDNPKSISPRSIANLIGITQVTGRMIAYVAVQARHMITSQETWNTTDVHFNYEKFFEWIVEMFEEVPEDIWVVETLAWWQSRVFGDVFGDANNTTASTDGSDASRGQAARKRRRAAVAAITATAAVEAQTAAAVIAANKDAVETAAAAKAAAAAAAKAAEIAAIAASRVNGA